MKPIKVCNGEVVTTDDVCEACKFYYPVPEVERLVEVAKSVVSDCADVWWWSLRDELNSALAPFLEK